MTTGTGKSELSVLLGRLIAEQRIELPILPTVALEVMTACQKEETDAAKLSAIIHKDQALAANVLRVANSAAYAGQVPCGSLTQAVGRLGMQLVGEIAVAVAVRGRAFAGKVCAELLAQLWRHAVITGFFCKEIARTRRRNVESAFLCGLLHDIGKAVLLTTVSKHVERGTVELAEIADALQEHHAAVGSQLARGWRLPPQIVEAIECHHDYDRAKSAQEAAMTVCLADMMAHFVAPAPGVQTVTVDALRRHPVLLALNLYADQFDALLVRADKAIALAEGMA
jgi:putative nucleotidyltransferase with HDIG domain